MEYIDTLKYIICGKDYVVNNYISISSPSVNDIIEFGETRYDTLITLLTRRPYDIMVDLWDEGIDYTTITDWDLFFDTASDLPIEATSILFGDLDFRNYVRGENTTNGLKVLYDPDDPENYIDEIIYRKIVKYLRYTHFISEKIEYDMGNEAGKLFLIKRMRRKRDKLRKDLASGKIRPHSKLFDMMMYCVNNSGCPYTYETIRDIPIALLYETYHYLLHDNARNNITLGIYAGRVDPTSMKDKSILEVSPDLHQ